MLKLHQFRVGILAPPLPSYVRDIYRGVLHYARREANWTMLAFPSSGQVRTARSPELEVDGMIAHVGDRKAAAAIRRLGLPCVNISARRNDLGFPCVWADNAAIGHMAADHLLGLGLRHFAYLGYGDAYFAEVRGDEFCEAIRERGLDCIRADKTKDASRTFVNTSWLIHWLRKLAQPCGIFTCGDSIAAAVLEACVRAGLRVPEDIAVVGVDDEETLCPFTAPPLSSIPMPGYQMGYQAAALLAELMRGGTPPKRPLLVDVPPLKARQSTDVIAVGDPLVSRAVRFIRARAQRDPITVAEVSAAMQTPRRTLDRHFVKALGWSPKHEIDRVRLERLQWYLSETDVTIKQIWIEMGFSSPKEPARFLRRHSGMTPTQYRRAHRVAATPAPPA